MPIRLIIFLMTLVELTLILILWLVSVLGHVLFDDIHTLVFPLLPIGDGIC